MMENKTAVILPVYAGDNPRWLEQALQSLQSQSLKRFLLILVADGPLNGALEKVIASVGKAELKVMRMPENRGLAVALNHALQYCFDHNMQYIARMDADDICMPHRLETQLNFLEQNKHIDVAGSYISEIDEQARDRNKVVEYPLTHNDCLRFFSKRDPLAHPAVMFRVSFFAKAGMYDEAYRKNQDTMLWYKGFMNDCKFANIDEVLLKFRITENFFRSRRNGWLRARQMMKARNIINKDLGFGLEAKFYAIGMFFLTLSPPWLKKAAYKLLR